MIETDLSEKEIERYIFGEMSDGERAAVEEKFFADDALFYEIADAENHLVDLYAQRKLSGDRLTRFEKSLALFPERREKLANARALAGFFDEENAEKSAAQQNRRQKLTFGQKIRELFSLKTPLFGAAAASLLILFLLTSVFLFAENRRKTDEIARLESRGQISNDEIELRRRIAESERRASELQNQIDDEREASGDLSIELEKEKARRAAIERELEKAGKKSAAPQVNAAPLVASIVLQPFAATRGGSDGRAAPAIVVEKTTARIAARLVISANQPIAAGDRAAVKINDRTIAQNLIVRRAGENGEMLVQTTLATKNLSDEVNRLTLFNAAGAEIGRYVFVLQKK